MAYNPNFLVFAGRYRFEPMGSDWDRGRSGFTSLVYDETEKRWGVIKRAETFSKRSAEGLKNEKNALETLKGRGVPQVYESGSANYDSKNYDYLVIEYIDGERIEKKLDKLSVSDRVDIITQFFGVLAQAHEKGIVNGDVDLKHLFWRQGKDKKELVMIDWGNAKLNVDPKKKIEFSYDLARAAEIIFSLVTRQGHPPAIGSIALPESYGIIDGLEPIPDEFRELCAWAPRTPSDRKMARRSAKELYEVSKQWWDAIRNHKKYRPKPNFSAGMLFASTGILAILAIVAFMIPRFFTVAAPTAIASNTSAMVVSETASITPSRTPEIDSPTSTSTEFITASPLITISPGTYSSLLTFDQTSKISSCWKNEANPFSKLLPLPQDGFYQRTDGNWAFNVSKDHNIDEYVQVDFGPCLDLQTMNGLASNIFVQRLDQLVTEPSREIGIFVENQNRRREYTLLLKDGEMFLRIRDSEKGPIDYPIQIVNPANIKSGGEYPRPSRSFRIMLFLEINNQGSDVIYLREGSLDETVRAEAIDPSGMFRIEEAMLPTMGNVQKIGLLGRGGKIDALIWPLTLLQMQKPTQ